MSGLEVMKNETEPIGSNEKTPMYSVNLDKELEYLLITSLSRWSERVKSRKTAKGLKFNMLNWEVMKLNIHNVEGQETGKKVELKKSIFGIEPSWEFFYTLFFGLDLFCKFFVRDPRKSALFKNYWHDVSI